MSSNQVLSEEANAVIRCLYGARLLSYLHYTFLFFIQYTLTNIKTLLLLSLFMEAGFFLDYFVFSTSVL